MEKPNARIGIEIETVFNADLIDIEIGDYHGGIDLNNITPEVYWNVQSDSSIDGYHSGFKECNEAEFVSKILRSKNDMFDALQNFQINVSGDMFELNELLVFNNSCGCHIHISFPNYRFKRKMAYEFYPFIRKYFFKLLRESNIPKSIQHLIKKQYFRDYAKAFDSKTLNERSREFNLTSEDRGLEWRSFNLCGIKTWKQFYEMFSIVYQVVEKIAELTVKYEFQEKVKVIDQNFIKQQMYYLMDYEVKGSDSFKQYDKKIEDVIIKKDIKKSKRKIKNLELKEVEEIKLNINNEPIQNMEIKDGFRGMFNIGNPNETIEKMIKLREINE